MEFKKAEAKKELGEAMLKKIAKQALEQIDKRQYETEAKQYGATKLLKIGIAFHAKRFSLIFRKT